MNASAAARRAGYSVKTAQQQSSDLLLNPVIQGYLSKKMAQRAERTEVTADYVLRGIKIEADKKTNKAGDKLKALELLGRHLAMFVDRQQVSGDDGGPVAIRVIKEYTGEKPT